MTRRPADLDRFGVQLAARSRAATLVVVDRRAGDALPREHPRSVRIDPTSPFAGDMLAAEVTRHSVLVWTDPEMTPVHPDAPSGAVAACGRAPWVVLEQPGTRGFVEELRRHGIDVHLSGWGPTPWQSAQQSEVALLWNDRPPVEPAPDGFRVVALMVAYNEADVIRPSVEHLNAQGIEVHLIDNWSTDGTPDEVADLVGNGVRAIERFPHDGPSSTYDWGRLLGRVEELLPTIETDWFVFHDVDERRDTPWPSMSFRDALWLVQRAGYDAIDHSMVEFRPVDDDFEPGTPPWDHLRQFEFSQGSIVSEQVKGWRSGPYVDVVSSGGHDIDFPDRRVFPLNFLLRHYSIRGQRHGEQKVFRDRKPRLNEAEHKRNWHNHYDRMRSGHRFLHDPDRLLRYDDDFAERFLVPRLARLAMPQRPPTASERARLAAVRQLRRRGLLASAVEARRNVRRALTAVSRRR